MSVHSAQAHRRKSSFVSILLVASILASLLTFTPQLQQTALAFDAPNPLLPLDGAALTATGYGGTPAFPPLAIPEFSWTAVVGATVYRVQLSQDIAFTTKVEFTTPQTTYIPISVTTLGDGLWYWRVRVDSPSASVYSGTFTFTKTWATTDNFPVLTAPSDSASIDFADAPTFSWQPVLGAASYRFELATSFNGFASPVYTQITLAFTHQPLTKLANGTYYWRVVPLDPGSHAGTPSEVRQVDFAYGLLASFPGEIPALIEPLDKHNPAYQPPTFTPTFRWTAVRGAQQYRLEYTTDPTCTFGVAGTTTSVTTPNTSYTPTSDLPNDVNYCWRVRAQSGTSISDWSETWEFLKQWYIQAVPLTPTNNYQHAKWLFFSWTPVPGAAYYKIEVSPTPSFPPGAGGFSGNAVNPYYVRPTQFWGQGVIWYWRVTPYDRTNNAGRPSSVFSFTSDYASQVPHQIYPFYYYLPNDFPPPNELVEMKPVEGRTVPFPVFMWHRAFDLTENEAAAYRIQVDDDPLFLSVNWDYKTENLGATPSAASPFNPTPGTVYYWRACSLASLAATDCQTPNTWSQVWPTHFDPTTAITTTQIALLRPINGSESVETMPLFEWQPLANATSYQVEFSQDPTLTITNTTTISVTVPYPAYSHPISLAKRSIGHLNYGTYYWRVRGLHNGAAQGDWSPTWRFQLASQSRWRASRALGGADNQLQVASDPVDLGGSTYELTNLYSSQDKDYWYFGFNATTGITMTYGLYLDLDHVTGSGAGSDARSFNVTAIPAHRPEYAIYVLKTPVGFSADRVVIYRWTGSGWANNPQSLSSVGGALSYATGYLELKVPNTAIGMQEETGSAALSLFSANDSTHNLQDGVPTSTSLAVLDRFTSVSERLNLRMPPSNASGDPTKFAAVPPFFFDYPPNTPWEGFNIKITLDPQFTTWVRDYALYASAPYLSAPIYTEQTNVQDINGDNTYYWRVRPQYNYVTDIAGAWSLPGRFERAGFLPVELNETVDFATPTLSWSMVEGAEGYDIQIDDDPNFGQPIVSVPTSRNTYTPITTLADGVYYWRVRVKRNTSITNDWTLANQMSVSLPSPAGLTPNDPLAQHVVPRAPTLCWSPLIVSAGGHPVLAAYKYRVLVGTDPNFSSTFETADTEQSCWTPAHGYPDGKFYWKVAMMDGLSKLGAYSPAAEFTKQYPVTTLLSPLGMSGPATPLFSWTALDGAAAYRFEVSLNRTFSPLYDSVTTADIRYMPTKIYAPNVVYFWRVAMVDKDNRMGPFTGSTILLADFRKVYIPMVKK